MRFLIFLLLRFARTGDLIRTDRDGPVVGMGCCAFPSSDGINRVRLDTWLPQQPMATRVGAIWARWTYYCRPAGCAGRHNPKVFLDIAA
jgi:hypothetical protein